MSPTKNQRIWNFYFTINKKKTNTKSMIEELEQYGFRKCETNVGVYDISARITLEQDYNASKFAGDLLKKYKLIQEIEVRKNAI